MPLFLQLSATNAKVSTAADALIAEQGLPVVHLGLLYVISAHGPLTPSDLERITGHASTTLRGRVQSLTRDGYLERRPNAADGRSALLRTTRAGDRLLARAWPVVADFERQVAARVPGGQARLLRALRDLADEVSGPGS